MKKTPDILEVVGAKKRGRTVVVGFSAETQSLIKNSREKLKRKNADMIVANDISSPGSGFGEETNRAVLLYAEGEPEPLPLMTKDALGHKILDRALELWRLKGEKGA